MDFVFEQIRTGGDRNFGYVIGDRSARVALLVDPSYSPEAVVERAEAQRLEVRYILNTHGHADHTNGNAKAKKLTGAPAAGHPDLPEFPDVALSHGQRLDLGRISIEILHVPGHSPDHIALHLPHQRVALTGDLLFVGKIGGTSNDVDAEEEYRSLERLITTLPEETTIWPGHDYGCRPASTMALEKSTNPFLLAPDLGAFLVLKRNWASFKAEHGLR